MDKITITIEVSLDPKVEREMVSNQPFRTRREWVHKALREFMAEKEAGGIDALEEGEVFEASNSAQVKFTVDGPGMTPAGPNYSNGDKG